MTALALDIGGTKILAALVDGPDVAEERRRATDLSAGIDALMAGIAELATSWAGRFDAVGAAVTGLVRDGIWQALNPEVLALPDQVPLVSRLKETFGMPAIAVNDAQAAAWGEYLHGAGRREDMVFLTVSTGVGGGIVAGGRLLGGLSGHFGQFETESGARFEDRVAGRWMAAEARRQGHALDAAGVFARIDEPWAEAIVAASAARVAGLCRNLQLALEPARIVIGGGIGLAPGYLGRVAAAVAGTEPVLTPRLVPAGLGANAGIVGVAALATQSMSNREN